MVTVEIAGRPYAVAPFKLGDLRKAAPFIDAMNQHMQAMKEVENRNAGKPKAEQETPTLTSLAEMSRALVEILAIGLTKVDPTMTADAIEEEADFSFIGSLQTAVLAILADSGLSRKGEAQAPSGQAQEGAGSPSSSDASSTSSPAPESKVEASAG